MWRITPLRLELDKFIESPVHRIVINIECLHQAINIGASNKAPFHFKEHLDLRTFYDTLKFWHFLSEDSIVAVLNLTI